MIQTYIDAAMRQAHYELIQDDEPYYGEIPELPGFGLRAGPWRNAGKTC